MCVFDAKQVNVYAYIQSGHAEAYFSQSISGRVNLQQTRIEEMEKEERPTANLAAKGQPTTPAIYASMQKNRQPNHQ